MPEPLAPAIGLGVLHLFYAVTPETDRSKIEAAIKDAQGDDIQVVPVAVLGHKADLAIMALGTDIWRLRALQSGLAGGGLRLVDSYVSMTEVSEYAKGMPEAMLNTRLYPQLPPEGMSAWCFYPMSKRRGVGQNWFTLPYEDRMELMAEHGKS